MSDLLKIPVCLTKRLADGKFKEMKYQIEVMDGFREKAIYLDLYTEKMFILVGPCESQKDIAKFLKNEEIE